MTWIPSTHRYTESAAASDPVLSARALSCHCWVNLATVVGDRLAAEAKNPLPRGREVPTRQAVQGRGFRPHSGGSPHLGWVRTPGP